MSKKMRPCLWFNGNAEEAVNFYLGVFKGSEILEVSRYPEDNPFPGGESMAGKIVTILFRVFDEEFIAINAGPEFQFSEAISFAIETEDQTETDYYWNTLTANGGEESMCGWLKDPFGLSWQVIPRRLLELERDPDPQRSRRATMAMLQMTKIDIAALEAAADAA